MSIFYRLHQIDFGKETNRKVEEGTSSLPENLTVDFYRAKMRAQERGKVKEKYCQKIILEFKFVPNYLLFRQNFRTDLGFGLRAQTSVCECFRWSLDQGYIIWEILSFT